MEEKIVGDVKASEDVKSIEGRSKTVVLFVVALAALAVGVYLNTPHESYQYETTVAGVPVKSTIPLSQLGGWDDIGLFESKNKTIISCNLELGATSQKPEERIYWINVGGGEKGIRIQDKEAFLTGNNDDEIMKVCHAFVCLKNNITCPTNMEVIKEIMLKANKLNIILDSNASAEGAKSYAELIGPLSYLQAQRADVDKDSTISLGEVKLNKLFVYPYVRYGDMCVLQPVRSLLQNTSGNETRDCDITPGVYLQEGDVNEITLEGSKIILTGDATRLHIESIIVGNIIVPEWITKLRGID